MADAPQTWRTPEYKKIYGKLDENIKEACKMAFKKWRDNPETLLIKPLNKMYGSNEAVSAEISYSVRAIGYHNAKKNSYVWFWVGTHEEYNNKLSKDYLKTKINAIKVREDERENMETQAQDSSSNKNKKGSVLNLSLPSLETIRNLRNSNAFDDNYQPKSKGQNRPGKKGPS